MNCKFTLDNFEVDITKTHDTLTIKAKHIISPVILHKTLDSDSIKAITRDPLFDIDIIYECLEDYSKKRPDMTTLTLGKDRLLKYSCQLTSPSITKNLAFEIKLEDLNPNPIVELESVLNRLSARMSVIERKKSAKNQSLKMILVEGLDKIEDKLTKMDRRLIQLESQPLAAPSKMIFQSPGKAMPLEEAKVPSNSLASSTTAFGESKSSVGLFGGLQNSDSLFREPQNFFKPLESKVLTILQMAL